MRRREFITALGGAAAWPLVTSAQEAGRTYRIGFLIPFGRDTVSVGQFLDELRLNGFIEGQNLSVVSGGFNVGKEQLAPFRSRWSARLPRATKVTRSPLLPADIAAALPNVCFSPESGHHRASSSCPLSAITGLMHRSNCVLFDDLVGVGPRGTHDDPPHSALMFAALMIGHHFSISAF